MKLPVILLAAASTVCAGQTYTATSLQTSTIGFANLIGLNNKGEVLGDACNFAGVFLNCNGTNRFPAVWSNGAINPLPIPAGYSYIAQLQYYGINDSGTVVGTLENTAGTAGHVFVWTNGVPSQLPDAPVPGACAPASAACTCKITGSSNSSGITAAGHIVGSTTYPSNTPGGQSCSAYWVYNGSTFRLLPFPVPAHCSGVLLDPPVINDADLVAQGVTAAFCSPPMALPPGTALIQTNSSYSFLPPGGVPYWLATSINDVGDVLGFWSSGTGRTDIVVWDNNGLHDLGPSGYAHMNQAGQVVYSGPPFGSANIAIWRNGGSTPVTLPANISPASNSYLPAGLNDAGQLLVAAGSTGYNNYLLTPSGPCATDVTSQVTISRTGFRYNHSTGLFQLIGSITNTSGATIPGPISLVFDNLPASATMVGIDGATVCTSPAGSPYNNGGPLAPGASDSGSINFIDLSQSGITYSLRVLAGPGGR